MSVPIPTATSLDKTSSVPVFITTQIFDPIALSISSNGKIVDDIFRIYLDDQVRNCYCYEWLVLRQVLRQVVEIEVMNRDVEVGRWT